MTDEYMYEKLAAYIILSIHDMGFDDEYSDYLDGEFLKDPNDRFLLELELSSSYPYQAYRLISEHMDNEAFDNKFFAKFLIERMKIFYQKNYDDLRSCTKKFDGIYVYTMMKPFSFLDYAYDYMGYYDEIGKSYDEEQIRKMIDITLTYYD